MTSGRDTRDDAALMTAHLAGDPDAFAELVRRHRDRLWAVALRTTGDPEDAADALQEALVAAFRRAGSFRGEAAVTTWLHRIVVNACLDRLRQRKARPTVPLPEDDTAPGPQQLTRPAGDPAEASERRADVMRALAAITPDQRAAVVLVDMEGYSVDEAAAILGCAPGTVKSRCSRGRARLVPLLGQYRRNHPAASAVEPATRPPMQGPATTAGRARPEEEPQ
jgi:RNA polymerase sigma-70 factor, ECF subfamily